MSRLDELLSLWHDEALDGPGVAELTSLLQSPENRRALVEEFWLSQAVGEALALDVPTDAGNALCDVPSEHTTRVPGTRKNTHSLARRAVILLTLAASVLITLSAILWLSQPQPTVTTSLARVVEVSGDVEILTPAGNVFLAAVGQSLSAGQTVRTGGEESYAVVEYPDATRLELHSDTIVRLTDSGRVVFSSGVVRADVPRTNALVLAAPQAEVRARDGKLLVACPTPQATRVDVEEGNAEVTRQSDGRVVEMGGGSYTVATMDLEPPVVRPMPTSLSTPVRTTEFRAARAAIYDGNDVQLAWHRALRLVEKNQTKHIPLLGKKAEGNAVFARTGNVLAVNAAGQVAVYDLAPFRLRCQWNAAPLALAISDDGSRVATLDAKKGVAIHDSATGTETQRCNAGIRLSRGLALSPDGKTLAVGCLRVKGEWVVQLFDADRGKSAGQLSGHDNPARLAAFSPDGKILASAGNDGIVRVFDLETRQLLHRITNHERPVCSLLFSPDGKTLAGGTNDGQVWLWQAETGQQERRIKAGNRAVLALAFSPDGTRLTTCGQAMAVQEWDLTP